MLATALNLSASGNSSMGMDGAENAAVIDMAQFDKADSVQNTGVESSGDYDVIPLKNSSTGTV